MNHKTAVLSTKSIVLVGMFAAVLGVLSIISIPTFFVQITLQTFAVALCGMVLGHKLGTIATIVYVLLGAVGVPIYSGMSGGIKVLFGHTGGFIFGFIFMAFLCGLSVKQKNKLYCVLLCLSGLAVCHILGMLQFSFVMNMSLKKSFLLASMPFLIKDILSVVGAYMISFSLRKRLL